MTPFIMTYEVILVNGQMLKDKGKFKQKQIGQICIVK